MPRPISYAVFCLKKKMVFPNHPRGRHANGRFVFARLTAIWRMARGDAIRHYLPGDGRNSRDPRVHFGARTDPARLADSPDAPDLSSDAQLLHLEGDLARGERCMGELGQT